MTSYDSGLYVRPLPLDPAGHYPAIGPRPGKLEDEVAVIGHFEVAHLIAADPTGVERKGDPGGEAAVLDRPAPAV